MDYLPYLLFFVDFILNIPCKSGSRVVMYIGVRNCIPFLWAWLGMNFSPHWRRITGINISYFLLYWEMKTCVVHECDNRLFGNTTSVVFPCDLDIAINTPGLGPGVLNQPIRCAFLSAVSDNQHGVLSGAVICWKTIQIKRIYCHGCQNSGSLYFIVD